MRKQYTIRCERTLSQSRLYITCSRCRSASGAKSRAGPLPHRHRAVGAHKDLVPALKRGLERIKTGEPALIDVVAQLR
jgi:hypothetical protein